MGDFRHWLTFEDLVVELDSDGAQVETWVPAFEVNSRMPCEVTALSGRELLAAQAIQSKITTRLKVHYRPGFKARIRAWYDDPLLVDDATIYNIEAVIPDPGSRRRFVTLLCSSGVNAG
jgi:SPP1 family predicted phage head-tail adaptor